MKEKLVTFNKEVKNVWNFGILLLELAAPVLLMVWAQEKEGKLHTVLTLIAAVLAANSLGKLFALMRR